MGKNLPTFMAVISWAHKKKSWNMTPSRCRAETKAERLNPQSSRVDFICDVAFFSMLIYLAIN